MLSAAAPEPLSKMKYTEVSEVGGKPFRGYPATCAAFECIAELPIAFSQGLCIVKAKATFNEFDKNVYFEFSIKTCDRTSPNGFPFVIDYGATVFKKVDANGSLHNIVSLHFGSSMNDLVRRAEEPTDVWVDATFPVQAQR
jgi:hypothetical protein